jgi:copper(I)-binding protein
MKKRHVPILIFIAAIALFALLQTELGFPYKVSGAFVRATPAKVSAGYMTIRNKTARKDTLVSVTADWAERAELHTIEADSDGILSMKQVKEIALPPHTTVKLENGGYHIMFYGVKRPVKEGERVPLVLHFRRAGKLPVTVPVRPITYKP